LVGLRQPFDYRHTEINARSWLCSRPRPRLVHGSSAPSDARSRWLGGADTIGRRRAS